MASLDHFLRTGRLGPIRLGMPLEAVRAALGEPDDVSLDRKHPLWKYGALQLAFGSDDPSSPRRLQAIYMYFRDPGETLPALLQLSGWIPSARTPRAELRAHLDEAGIRFEPGDPAVSDTWKLASSALMTFDEDRLYLISAAAPAEPEFKQVSVNVPLGRLDIIRREAAARGLSISRLCSLWIEERVAQLQPQ